MDEETCHNIYAKLTKEERFEAIEMLVNNFDSFDEIEICVSALDLHLTRSTSNSMTDNVDEDEIHGSFQVADKVYVENNIHEKLFSCENCDQQFTSERNYKCHMKVYHGNKKEVNTLTVKSLQCLMIEKKLFPCEKCNKQLTSKVKYTRHMKLYHDNLKKELFLCKKCDIKLISKASLYMHNKRVHKESGRFICNVCSKLCGSNADLERHRRVHTGEKPFTCSICSKKFGTKKSLKVHIRVHTGEKPYSCSICLKTFRYMRTLKGHMQSIHKEETGNMLPPKKLITCDKCDKQLTSKWNYKYHMKRYHDDQKEKDLFACKNCNKKFISKGTLYGHNKRVHEENERFICEVCSKKSASQADLERHRKIHTRENPYSSQLP